MISGAEIMVKCLQNEGVSYLFGYPGAAICPFYDYITKTDIKHVLVRQEQNAAHMANGYARASGKPGVCVATSGPGATNLITGIATAYMDSIPLIAITGQVNSWLLGRDVFQEADITGACQPFTKHSYLVKDAASLPRIFKEAFHIATTGRPGPVLIDVPTDIQLQEVESFNYPAKADIIGYKPRTQGHPMQIKKALQAIKEAERPVICCGGGVVLGRCARGNDRVCPQQWNSGGCHDDGHRRYADGQPLLSGDDRFARPHQRQQGHERGGPGDSMRRTCGRPCGCGAGEFGGKGQDYPHRH